MIRSLFLLVALFSLSACGSYKLYKEDFITGPSANLTLETEAKTIFPRYLTTKLYDYKKIENGLACAQKGIIDKNTIITNDALYGYFYASSKKDNGVTKRIPANTPIRAYVEFQDGTGNTTYVNYADIVFTPKKGADYKFGYKRTSNANGDFYFLEKTRKGYTKISGLKEFNYGVCDKHLDKK